MVLLIIGVEQYLFFEIIDLDRWLDTCEPLRARLPHPLHRLDIFRTEPELSIKLDRNICVIVSSPDPLVRQMQYAGVRLLCPIVWLVASIGHVSGLTL